MFAPLNLCVWIPACAQTIVETAVNTSAVDGACYIQPSQTHAPILPFHMENFIASMCLCFLDLSQRVSVYILDWSHFPSHFYRLEDTPMAPPCTFHQCFAPLFLYYSFFISLLLTLYLTQQSCILDWFIAQLLSQTDANVWFYALNIVFLSRAMRWMRAEYRSDLQYHNYTWRHLL